MSQTDRPQFPTELPPDEAELTRQLLSLRQTPSPALQRRVQAIPRSKASRDRTLSHRLAGGVIAVTLMALLFISSPVQATLNEVHKVMGQVHLIVREVWPRPTATVMLTDEAMSLAQAQALAPFELALPTYLPDPLNRTSQEVLVTQLAIPIVKIRWRDTEGGFVQLSAQAANSGAYLNQTLVGPESSEAILLNGQEAVLVRGGWDEASRTWNNEVEVTMLIWTTGEVQYKLLSFSRLVAVPELIAIAESLR